MKVLLRQCVNEFYVWKTAEYKNGEFRIPSEFREVFETDIVAIKGAEDTNYVVCKYCGEKIPDNPESIERHFAEKEAQKNCLICKNCRPNRVSEKTTSVTKNSDGTYNVTETSVAKTLTCSNSWRDINHKYTALQCPYLQCRKYGTSAYGGVLMKCPDLFETQITHDLLLKKKYTYVQCSNDRFLYNLKCRNTLFAAVNECGIVEYFMLEYQYRHTFFYYSAKYNKLFYADNGKYVEGKPSWVSQAKYDQIKARIEGIYKGVKVNE